MKKISIIVLIFNTLQLSGQTDIFLSDAIQVAPDLTYGSRAPRIALLEDGNPIIYWGKTGSSPKMYVTKWQNEGFLEPIVINTNSIDVDLWASGLGPQLANFGDTVFLVFESYGEGIWCVRSTDGGESFETPVSVHELPQGRVATLPSVAVDNDGNPVVSFVTTNSQEAEALYEVAVSLDGGLSFEPSVVANLSTGSDEVCECCPASIAVHSNEEILLTFRNNNNNIRDIWATKSLDGGESFPVGADLDDTDWQLFSCPASGPHSTIFGDSLVAVFFSSGEGSPRAYLSTMHIPTMTKGQQIKLPTFSGEEAGQNFPRVAGNQDTLGVAWEENAASSKDIVMAYSVNGSLDLSNQLVKIAEGDFSFRYPDIAFSNGVFHIVYEDLFLGAVMYRQASFSPLTSTTFADQNTFDLIIKPNPFQTSTVINFENNQNENVIAKLFDVNGKVIKSWQTTDNQLGIDNTGLNVGTYLLQLESKEQVQTVRIIYLK